MGIEWLVAIFTIIGTIVAVLDYISRHKNKVKSTPGEAQDDKTDVQVPSQHLTSDKTQDFAPKSAPALESFKKLIEVGNYKEACALAMIRREALTAELPDNILDGQLALSEFDIFHAKALIYIGKTHEGIAILNEVITRLKTELDLNSGSSSGIRSAAKMHRDMLLGLAYNHKGYTYWMTQGHCLRAIDCFSESVSYYRSLNASGDETATAYDNLGRVYAQLGQRAWAEYYIENGRKMRVELMTEGDITADTAGRGKNRYALSLISSAIANLSFGNCFYAKELSEQAVEFSRSPRVQGLALIIQGQAQRYIGSLWSYQQPVKRVPYSKSLEEALFTLQEAEKKFQPDVVQEPIRLCQIYNEIACVFREQMQLKFREGNLTAASRLAREAEDKLLESIAEAEKQNYHVLCVDFYEDLARLYKMNHDQDHSQGSLSNAGNYLKKAESFIPRAYFVKDGRIPNLNLEDCIEEYWQHLGKIYALRGHIAFDGAEFDGNESASFGETRKNALLRSIENYILALVYFGKFLNVSGESNLGDDIDNLSLMNQQIFLGDLIKRLNRLPSGILNEVRKDLLDDATKNIILDHVWIRNYFTKTVDRLLKTKL